MSRWKLSVRIRSTNPDHHLFNNHGTWWCHFWAIAEGIYQKRFRINLHTRCQAVAREERDKLLAGGWQDYISNQNRRIEHAN